MDLDAINTLIGLNKTRDSIKILDKLCVGPLATFKGRVVLLNSRLDRFNKHNVDGTTPDELINDIHKSILSLAMEMNNSVPEDSIIDQLIQSQLLLSNSFPFLDRTNFRKRINKKLASEKAHIFLVHGAAKSGMSHLGKFLENLSENLKIITLIPCDIPKVLDEPHMHLGEKLAKFISFSMGMDADFDQSENAQFKFIQFLNKLKERIKSENKIPVFFLHDFHKINEKNENLLEFILMLITSINSDFPKSIFIIAGLNFENLRNWHDDLQFRTEIYEMETAGIDDLKFCLSNIYSIFPNEIESVLGQPISEEKYIQEMVETMLSENEVVIKDLGFKLSIHLKTLKNQ